MRDPGLVQLELAMTYHCDQLLDSEVMLESGDVVLSAHWYHRGGEFRARLVVPPGRQIAWPRWLWWRLCGQQLRLLPSRPIFEWYGPLGWQRADTIARWRRVLDAPGGTAPGASPNELAGRPVRPRPGLPLLNAGAAAVPERAEYEVRHYPLALLKRHGVEE